MRYAGINTVDLSPFTRPEEFCDDDRDNVVRQVGQSCRSIGFLHITGHGVGLDLIDGVFSASTSFFAQSEEEKMVHHMPQAQVPRGYFPYGKENFACLVGEKKPNDLVEKFRVGPFDIDSSDPYFDVPACRKLFPGNTWPAHRVDARSAIQSYYRAIEQLAAILLSIFEQALRLPAGFFNSKMNHHTSILSMNCYPPVGDAVSEGQLRIAEHTDIDMFTIVAQDSEIGGLEVCTREGGEWLSVPYVSDAFVVNIGDCLMYWTNDYWVSTRHRVALPPLQQRHDAVTRRHSVAYFVGANYDAPIDVLGIPCGGEDDAPAEKGCTIFACLEEQHVEGNSSTVVSSAAVKKKYPNTTFAGWRKARIKQAMKELKKTP